MPKVPKGAKRFLPIRQVHILPSRPDQHDQGLADVSVACLTRRNWPRASHLGVAASRDCSVKSFLS
jgi:hypothetical protein